MLHFLQPAATLFIGLALSVYGLIHSVRHAPQATAFQAAVQAMPDAIAVLVFTFGITAVIVGVILLVSGIKGVRSRSREINHAYGRHNHNGPRNSPRYHRSQRDDYDDDWDGHAAYN